MPKSPETEETTLCAGAQTVFTTKTYFGTSSYCWNISPASAGATTSQTNIAMISWVSDFSGEAKVSYSIIDAAGKAYPSEPITVNIQALTINPNIAAGPASVEWNDPTSVFTAVTEGDEYKWQIEPSIAGSITNNGSTAIIHWAGDVDHTYVGQVLVSYNITVSENNCSFSSFSPALSVDLLPKPPETSITDPCAGTNSFFNAPSYTNAESYEWYIIPANAGVTTSQSNTATINWFPSYSGQANISYSVIDDTERTYTSAPVSVNINALPAKPGTANGPTTVEWNNPTSVFTAVTEGDDYQWQIEPSNAGTITVNGNTATINWAGGIDHTYVGQVQVSYKIIRSENNCGFSEVSTALPVDLLPKPPATSATNLCAGTNIVFDAPLYANAVSYRWNITPAFAGVIASQLNKATINWSSTFSGQANVSYLVIDATGKTYASPPREVTIQTLPLQPEIATGPPSVTWNESTSVFSVASSANTDTYGYQWSLAPLAGMISYPTNTSPMTVTWNHQYIGTVHTVYKVHNTCGWSEPSPVLPAVLQPAPPEIDDESPCSGTPSVITAPNYVNATGYNWNISPENAGTITGNGVSATIAWNPVFAGGKVVVGYNVLVGTLAYSSPTIEINVQSLPAVPPQASGSVIVVYSESTTVYSASAGYSEYLWEISPVEASASSTTNGNQLFVTWNKNYIDRVNISYRVPNNCGWSELSPVLPVILQAAPPEIDDESPCSGTPSVITAPNYVNATGYNWNISPENAGIITGNGTSAIIAWNPVFAGGKVVVGYTVSVGAASYSSPTIEVNVQSLPAVPPQALGSVTVAYSESSTIYTASTGYSEYLWKISPVEASESVMINGNQLVVFWNKNYIGKVNISCQVRNACGWSLDESPPLTVTLQPATPVIDQSEACSHSETVVFTQLYQNATTYQWQVLPSGAGQIEGNDHQATIRWSSLYTGESDIFYTVTNSAQESFISLRVQVILKEIPQKPALASGPDNVYLNHPVETYQATTSGMDYEWIVTPSQAAEIRNPSDERTEIVWSLSFLGEATVSYRVQNECGWSELSEPVTVRIFKSDLLEDIPEIFTPNGDGFNDTWEIPVMSQYPEAKVRIYNRAKRLMVELKGAQLPWDGRDRNGNLLESGYYLYQIELQRGGKTVSGYVTILR